MSDEENKPIEQLNPYVAVLVSRFGMGKKQALRAVESLNEAELAELLGKPSAKSSAE